MKDMTRRLLAAMTIAAGAIYAGAAVPTRFEDWPKPQAPFHIVGDVYYVGTKGLAAYLVRTPAGAILIDGTLERNVPIIEANIRALDLKPSDVKILLNTHAHFDHAAGLARLKRDTGATMLSSVADRWALEHGTSRGDNTAGISDYPPVTVDRTFADGEAIRLGGATLVARLTPGHTPGCTSWTLTTVEKGRPLAVVIPCSVSVAGNVLVGNKAYPGIVADYRRSFAMLESLKADVVLPAHPEAADVIGRHDRGESYVAPGLLREITRDAERDFNKELARQESGK